jgi:hypothetical protein
MHATSGISIFLRGHFWTSSSSSEILRNTFCEREEKAPERKRKIRLTLLLCRSLENEIEIDRVHPRDSAATCYFSDFPFDIQPILPRSTVLAMLADASGISVFLHGHFWRSSSSLEILQYAFCEHVHPRDDAAFLIRPSIRYSANIEPISSRHCCLMMEFDYQKREEEFGLSLKSLICQTQKVTRNGRRECKI